MPSLPLPTRRLRALGLCASPGVAALSACSRDGAAPAPATEAGGTLVIATPGEVDILLPPLVASLQGAQITSQLFDRLAEIGDSLNTVNDVGFAPRLATRWEWASDSLSVRFAIDPRARWHDGRPVRAEDVQFSFDVYTDPATGASSAPLLAGVDSISTPDSLTAVAHYSARSPEQFFNLVYNLYVLPKHLLGSVP